jgi:FkbM family methyltransferase
MSNNHQYGILTRIKKFFFPTAYDRLLQRQSRDLLEFYNKFINAGDLCFDIGANYGSRTDIFLKLGANTVALEPQQKCYSFLQKKYGRRATVLNKGAGKEIGILNFYINDQNSQVSTFSVDWIDDLKQTRFSGNEWNRTEQVEVVTLDSLIAIYGIPQFIKIDVEGYEPEVLKGLSKPFKFLSFEYAVPEKTENLIQCLDILQQKFTDLKVNYAIGDEAKLQLPEWVTIEKMKEFAQTEIFKVSYAGDVYIKHN